MSYPQGYLYQAPGSLALYSCPAYGASALAAPRSEELARSASGSAFSPYPGSAAFTAQAATGFGSPLQYSADAAAAAAGFPSYMVTGSGRDAGLRGARGAELVFGGRGPLGMWRGRQLRSRRLGWPPRRLSWAPGGEGGAADREVPESGRDPRSPGASPRLAG